jgi:hypothetical protein
MTTSRSGGCLCGAVRFVAEGVETGYHACHCGMCRRWSSGAPFFGAPVERVVFSPSEQLARYASSEWAERGFCRACGSNLFYFLKATQTYTMCVGAFDDAASFRLAREIFVDQQPEGYCFAGERPRLTEAEVFAEYSPPPA